MAQNKQCTNREYVNHDNQVSGNKEFWEWKKRVQKRKTDNENKM